ncbi:uncharacterized protein CTRU02_206119 [Colletotrichum truncatum]|uniref:Uncharacterized protein n=1 Tax=Colletotrichum truncatum TaxID=5467 RepID=A0ACC3Z5X8_COLTU|nr:uncharacterized protein CTRU02_10467 [Colletotrichum truncatum]KAF6787204.1 hypothetical protein CTRU02_10467 [Colletotrichum truncatum]
MYSSDHSAPGRISYSSTAIGICHPALITPTLSISLAESTVGGSRLPSPRTTA